MSESCGRRPGGTDADRSAPAVDGDRRGATVLHVDDDPGVADTAASFVERGVDGATVVTTTSATDGLARVAAGNVDCIVTDLRMPGMDGAQFLRALAPAGVPVVLFTSCGWAEVRAAGCAGHATAHVRKAGGREGFQALARRVRALL